MNCNILFSYNVGIWGNVSDWVMIFVTTVTALLILITLRSQMKVQSLQETTSRIENERFRFEIMPSFELKCDIHNGQDKETGIDILVYFELKVKSNPAKNVHFNIYSNPNAFVINQEQRKPKEFMNVDTNLLFDGYFHSPKNTSRNDDHHKIFWNCPISFRVEFEDYHDNKYEQYLIGDLTLTDSFFQAYQPVFLSKHSTK